MARKVVTGCWGRQAVFVSLATVALWLSQTPFLGGGVSLAESSQGECPNEQVRVQELYAARLPDCRAYEQVSPTDKNGTDAVGNPGFVQSAPSGDKVTFNSIAPFPGTPSPGEYPTYVASRDDAGWSTEGVLPQFNPAVNLTGVVGLTEDLSKAIFFAYPSFPAPAPEAQPGQMNVYVRDNINHSYRLLAATPGFGGAHFAGATANDSHILFESRERLLPQAAPEAINLYEWDEGTLTLAGALEGGDAPVEGAVAGPGGSAVEAEVGEVGGASSRFYTEHTISEDGSRIYFSDIGTGQIYMREPIAERTVPVSSGPAYWRDATPDGAWADYTESGELYRFSAANDSSELLTHPSSGSAGVLGTLGMSREGAYIYFVATAVLAGASGAGEPLAGSANLYLWHESSSTHEGVVTFVARLSNFNDSADWRDSFSSELAGPDEGWKGARVTPDGTVALFSSSEPLTKYDNAGQNELFRYSAPEGELICVSCNPNAPAAISSAFLAHQTQGAASLEGRNPFLTHNLSDDGSRIFFQTAEALIPADTNGEMDVYEWEEEGAESCPQESGGCVFLISTGQSTDQSYFGDASADGSDVFFFTRQPLVSQDQDVSVDVYDALVDGGFTVQNPASSPLACAGEECRGAPSEATVLALPSSAAFTASGNLPPMVVLPAVIPKAKPPLTHAQMLAKALKACRAKPRHKRHACEVRARRSYGRRPPARMRARRRRR